LEAVFTQLRNAGLTLKGSKCKIGVSEVRYLGHVFSAKGIAPCPSKTAAVKSWPVPADKTSLKRFLGLTSYYRRFMESYATIAAPLYELLKDDAPFIWTENSQAAFDRLKNCLTSAPTLCAPNFSDSFQVITDASGTGLGAILEQRGRVIAFASRSLRKSERNYSAIEKECLAIIFALKTFRHYLLGRSFTILSDHAPLQWLAAQKMDGRLARWALSLQEYDYDIKYRPGSSNGNAYALSRSTVNLCALTIQPDIPMNVIRQEQQRDPTLRAIAEALKNDLPFPSTLEAHRRLRQVRHQLHLNNGVIVRTVKPQYATETAEVILVPTSLRQRFLYAAHDAPVAGHFGVSKTLARLRSVAYWPNMAKDIAEYCRTCDKCQQSKPPAPTPAPLQPFPIGRPWERYYRTHSQSG
ncbi:Retrovirus-related Pol polyprotein from transposon, partial [Trichinella sp. T6]